MLRSQDSGMPQRPGRREKITTVATTVNTLSGIPSFLLKHLTAPHLFTFQDCTIPLSGESVGAGSSQTMQRQGSLLWGDIGMSCNSIFHVQTHSHSVAQASQKHARGLLPHLSRTGAAPEPLRESSVLHRSLSNKKSQHCLSFELKAMARGELPQDPV